MRVWMLETRYGSPDGHRMCIYHENIIYELPDGLARHFIARRYARIIIIP